MSESTTSALTIWQQADEVKKLFAPTLTEIEFHVFMGLGKKLGANPFTREIWAYKFGQAAATIFCGRDFYRRKAAEQPNYNGHSVESIYANDNFEVENGFVKHKYTLTNRGELIGAYCIVKRKGVALDYFVKVLFSEYNLNQSLWKTKPETMIKKVAEAQALRAAFQEVFEGTYDESEVTKTAATQDGGHVVMASDQQIEAIQLYIDEGFLSEAQATPIKTKVEKAESMTNSDAEALIKWLQAQKEKSQPKIENDIAA